MKTPGPIEVKVSKPAIGLSCESLVKHRDTGTERCGLAASLCEVSGQSYSTRAVLCGLHRAKAEEQGFKVKVVPGATT